METNNDYWVVEYPELVCKCWGFFPVENLKCEYFLLKLFLNALFQAWFVLSSVVFFCFSLAAILQFSTSKILWAKRRVIEVTHSGGKEGVRQPVLSRVSSSWCINLRKKVDLLLLMVPEESHREREGKRKISLLHSRVQILHIEN